MENLTFFCIINSAFEFFCGGFLDNQLTYKIFRQKSSAKRECHDENVYLKANRALRIVIFIYT